MAQLPQPVVEAGRPELERAVGAHMGGPVQHDLVGVHEPDVGLRVVRVGGDHVHGEVLSPPLQHDDGAVLRPRPVVEVDVGVPDLHRPGVPGLRLVPELHASDERMPGFKLTPGWQPLRDQGLYSGSD